jgi:hypothetical protein
MILDVIQLRESNRRSVEHELGNYGLYVQDNAIYASLESKPTNRSSGGVGAFTQALPRSPALHNTHRVSFGDATVPDVILGIRLDPCPKGAR